MKGLVYLQEGYVKVSWKIVYKTAFVAQLGERKTEDLKVRGSIPREGIFWYCLQLFYMKK